MLSHLTSAHGTCVRAETGKSVITLENFGITSKFRKVILFKDEIFVHVSEVRNNILHTGVLHVGPDSKTPGFRYSVEISRTDGSGRHSAHHAVWNYTKGFDRLIDSGNCAGFTYDFAKSCAVEGTALNVYVNITDSET
jgi:hypothetical protein